MALDFKFYCPVRARSSSYCVRSSFYVQKRLLLSFSFNNGTSVHNLHDANACRSNINCSNVREQDILCLGEETF